MENKEWLTSGTYACESFVQTIKGSAKMGVKRSRPLSAE